MTEPGLSRVRGKATSCRWGGGAGLEPRPLDAKAQLLQPPGPDHTFSVPACPAQVTGHWGGLTSFWEKVPASAPGKAYPGRGVETATSWAVNLAGLPQETATKGHSLDQPQALAGQTPFSLCGPQRCIASPSETTAVPWKEHWTCDLWLSHWAAAGAWATSSAPRSLGFRHSPLRDLSTWVTLSIKRHKVSLV